MSETQNPAHEDFYDENIVPWILDMDDDGRLYFSLGAAFALLSVFRAASEGKDVLEAMVEAKDDANELDPEALSVKMLSLAAFLDRRAPNRDSVAGLLKKADLSKAGEAEARKLSEIA